MLSKIFKAIKTVVVGLVKGASETTLIPSIIREARKFKITKGLIKYADINGDGKINGDDLALVSKYLDVNADGKVDLRDVQDLKWETLGKLAGLIAAFCTLLYFVGKYAPGLLMMI